MWADNQKNIFPYFITLLCFPTLVHLTFFGFVWQRKSLKTLYNFTVQYYEGQSLFGHSKQVQKPYIIIPDSPINRVTTYCILFHFFYNRNMFSSFSHNQLLQSIVFFFFFMYRRKTRKISKVCVTIYLHCEYVACVKNLSENKRRKPYWNKLCAEELKLMGA